MGIVLMSKAWLDLDYDCYYGGEEIAGKLHIESASSKKLSIHLAVIQFGGFLSIDPNLIDPARFDQLKRSPNYALDSGVGGGRIIKSDPFKVGPNAAAIYSTTPSIVTAAVSVEASSKLSCILYPFI